MASAPSRYISIAEAADLLDVKPWDVVRLIEADQITSIELVDINSLQAFKERTR